VKYFGLIWKNAWRKKVRTSLTVLSVLVAFLLYALLNAVGHAMTGGVDLATVKRLIVIDKISLINLLPISYLPKIASIPGVEAVTFATWFGGYYQDSRNQFPQFPIDPDSYFRVYTELQVPPEALQAFKSNRTGMLASEPLAETYGWKVGDRIPIQSSIWRQKDGSRSWQFDLVGTFTTRDRRGSGPLMLFRYDYFDEARQFGEGLVGWYALNVSDGADATGIAKQIDAQFANSPNETETSTEQAFAASFVKQFGNIALIIQLILGAVFFTLLLVAGNTMAQSVRERIGELAVMKTVGFRDSTMLGVVLSESVLIMAMGGVLGLAIGWFISKFVNEQFSAYVGNNMYLTGSALLIAIVIMIGAGIAAGAGPAIKAMRLSIVDALARG
jgi:putative ABC transport system permease protein